MDRAWKLLFLSFAIVISLGSCQKESSIETAPAAPIILTVTHNFPPQNDTIPDGAALKVKLQQDSTMLDETALFFNHSASSNYNNIEDARYFPGFGKGSLASLTQDNVPCAIQGLPCTDGYPVYLKITAKNDGKYLLKTSFVRGLPGSVGIWLKDAYRKDSLNIRLSNYSFDIIKSDTNSYGTRRFSIVIH